MISAIGYLRRSHEKQRNNSSLDIQKGQILALAQLLEYEIIFWVIDDCVSAYKNQALNREGIQKLICCTKEKKCQGYIFYEESRLSRMTFDFVVQVYLPLMNDFPDLLFYKSSKSYYTFSG